MLLLQAENITKRFPGTTALNKVQLQLEPGEIHAIVGENGAGKSTLMKILSGVYSADEGQIFFEGNHINPANPREAALLGIGIVHQELSLVPTLTVAENIFPGRLPTNAFGFVKFQQLFAHAQRILSELQVDLDPRTPLAELSIANQQLVEIAKALSMNCKVLILDEPTSALTERETEILLSRLKQLAARGVGILYISHKLREIFALADRITVLRDGHYIGTQIVAQSQVEEIVRMMVGREIDTYYPPKKPQHGSALLEIRNFQLAHNAPKNSFTLYRGEIVGFAGLIGAGRTELARAIFGADPKAAGQIFLDGKPLSIHSPADAIRHGIGYLPEDRKSAGLFLTMAVRTNIAAASISQISSHGFINTSKERDFAWQYVEQLHISTPSIDQEVRRLSGGNQQKTLLAKWLMIKPRVLIVDEPTRGIDVGARREIHFLLRELAENGIGVWMISSELPEILGMSDRIMVMHEGAIVAEIPSEDASEEYIMNFASGHAGV